MSDLNIYIYIYIYFVIKNSKQIVVSDICHVHNLVQKFANLRQYTIDDLDINSINRLIIMR